MKRILKFLSLIFIISIPLIFTNYSHANMAAPDNSDLSTSITFKNNDDISVLSEELNIRVSNSLAKIEAIYEMKNIKDYDVSTKSMFISPNIENSEVFVSFNDKNISYETKDYYHNYGTTINVEDWEYVVLNENYDEKYDNKIQTINFVLNFKALEEAIIKVTYDYRLGGRPSRTDHYRYGEIYYYLKPATTWNDFSNLTINLELSKDMPVLERSSLPFTKISNNLYQYKSNSLPDSNLEIKIGLNWYQKFILQFKSPYFWMNVRIFTPIILIFVSVIVLIIVIINIIKKRNKKKRV